MSRSSSSSSSSARLSGGNRGIKGFGASGRSQLPAVTALLMQSVVRGQQVPRMGTAQQQQVQRPAQQQQQQQQQIEVQEAHRRTVPSTTPAPAAAATGQTAVQSTSGLMGLGAVGAQQKERKDGEGKEAAAQQQQQQQLLLQQVAAEVQRTRVLLRHARAAALHQGQEGRLEHRMRLFMLPSRPPKGRKFEAP
mmetsp:Transcript_10237/g.26694  ORF Transcript_10237/g.26694 Transcript_10237/m.26694 type:complete len:193 (-) Transcript_10237:428-1006(-)